MTYAPTLKPIEEAPEGIDLQLWYKRKDGSFMAQIYPKRRPFITPLATPATHFTLWPKELEPVNSWEDHLNEFGNFADSEGRGRLIAFTKKWAVENPALIKRMEALRDYLNHHYPQQDKDNG